MKLTKQERESMTKLTGTIIKKMAPGMVGDVQEAINKVKDGQRLKATDALNTLAMSISMLSPGLFIDDNPENAARIADTLPRAISALEGALVGYKLTLMMNKLNTEGKSMTAEELDELADHVVKMVTKE
jgi:hypothetical protein